MLAGLDRFTPVFTMEELTALEQLREEFQARLRFSEEPVARTHVPAPFDPRQVEFDRVENIRFSIDEEMRISTSYAARISSMNGQVYSHYQPVLGTDMGADAALIEIEDAPGARGVARDGALEPFRSPTSTVRLVERWVNGERAFNRLVRLPEIASTPNRTASLDHTHRHELTLRDGTLLFATRLPPQLNRTAVTWKLDVEPQHIVDVNDFGGPLAQHLPVGGYAVTANGRRLATFYVYPSGAVELVATGSSAGQFGLPRGPEYYFDPRGRSRYVPHQTRARLFYQGRWQNLRPQDREVNEPVVIER